MISSTYLIRNSAHWVNPSKELSEMVDKQLKAKLDEYNQMLNDIPNLDVGYAANKLKKDLSGFIREYARHNIQLGIANDLEMQWSDFELLAEGLAESAAKLKGSDGYLILSEEDVFNQREVAIARDNGYFEVQADHGSTTGKYVLEIISLAMGSEWTTEKLSIPKHAPLIGQNNIGQPSINQGTLEIEILNNRLISIVNASSHDEDVTDWRDIANKFQPGVFYLNDHKIEITLGSSLQDIAKQINENQEQTIATIELAQTGLYRLALSSRKLGIENAALIEDLHGNLFSSKFIEGKQYSKIDIKNNYSMNHIIESINGFTDDHGVIAIFADSKLRLRSKIMGEGNDIRLKNEHEIFGDLFRNNNGSIRKNMHEQDAVIIFDGDTKNFKSNNFYIALPKGGLSLVLYDKPAMTAEKQALTVRVSQESIIEATENFLVSYYKLLNFLGARKKDSTAVGAALENFPDAIRFDKIFKDLGVSTIYNTKEFKSVGIDFKTDDIRHYNDENAQYARRPSDMRPNLMSFNRNKFKDALDKNPENVQKLFKRATEIIGTKKLYVLHAAGGAIYDRAIESITLDINKKRAKLKSTHSLFMEQSKVFQQGHVFLNGKFIEIKEKSDINSLVNQLNEKSEETGVRASVLVDGGKSKIILEKSHNFDRLYDKIFIKWPPLLADYDNVFGGIFDIDRSVIESREISHVENADTPTIQKNGVLIINGSVVEIVMGDTLEVIKDKVTRADVGVICELIHLDDGAQKLSITADSYAEIQINDQDGILHDFFPSGMNVQSHGEKFFDVSSIIQASVFKGSEEKKKALLIPKKMTNIKDVGDDIRILDWPSDHRDVSLTKLELFYTGESKAWVELKLYQGIADKFYNIISDYMSYTGRIKNAPYNIQHAIRGEEANIDYADKKITEKRNAIIKDFIKAMSKKSKSYVVQNMFDDNN